MQSKEQVYLISIDDSSKASLGKEEFSMEFRSALNVIGLLICGTAAFLLLPAMADAIENHSDWEVFIVSALGLGFIGSLLFVATCSSQPLELSLRGAYLLIGLSWIVLPLLAAIPLMSLGIGYVDAVFEATSGITTTGSTVLTGLDNLQPGILLWRALLQWIGGVGIIVMAVFMMPFLRVGGAQLFKIESSSTSDKVEPRSFVLVSNIVLIYVFLTLACAVAYVYFGMSVFDAWCHAMTTISTGGYSTHDASFGYFTDWRLHWAGTVFMLSGALPFYIYVKAVRGNFSSLINDSQARVLVSFLAIVSIAMAFWPNSKTHLGFFDSLTLTAFNITSVVTTTGFATTDYTLWGPGAVGLFLVLMFIGGCSGSTSGSIKIFRFQILIEIVRVHIRKLVSPNRVIVGHFEGKPLPDDVPFSILAFIAIFVITIAICTVILAFMGLDLVTAYSASITAITNVGPGLGPIVGPAGNFQTIPDGAKLVLSGAMILGRLEVFTLLVMFDRNFWDV